MQQFPLAFPDNLEDLSKNKMVKNTEKKDLKIGCRANDLEKTEKRNGFNNLFDTEWEVFVIKKDKITGEYVGKTACCALSPV